MNEVTVSVDITEEDIYQFQKRFLYQRFPPAAIILFVLAMVTIGILMMIDSLSKGIFAPGSLILVIVPVVMLVGFPMSLKKAAKNAIATNKLLQKTQHYALEEEGLKTTSESGNGFIRWNEFYKAMETKESYLFYISKQQAYIIPKRCLTGTEEETAFIRMCLSKVPVPKEKKGFFSNILRYGCLVYILLFIGILVAVMLLTKP